MEEQRDGDVLVVGAGPTGLTLALWLARAGIRARIIDKKSGPGESSRAMVVHARTLEFYQQLGFAGEMVEGGVILETAHLRKSGREFGELRLDDIGTGLTPFPFLLVYPQDAHERLLVEKLKELGIDVEWVTELSELCQSEDCVEVSLKRDGVVERAQFAYLCGCDGAESRVRRCLDLPFIGGTYEDCYYVADMRTEERNSTDAFVNLDGEGFALMLPVRSSGMHRVIGIVPAKVSTRSKLSFEDVSGLVERLLNVRVMEVNWVSVHQVHHRVTEKLRVGRCFLAGDAAHAHSPAGGQGMNTGIGDAVNLAWKLAAVIKDDASVGILDSYDAERLPLGKAVVRATDRIFAMDAGKGIAGRAFRAIVMPLLLPLFALSRRIRNVVFRYVSQIHISYRKSALSSGSVGAVRGGDRLPWVRSRSTDNYELLQSRDWQVHVYGEVNGAFETSAEDMGLSCRSLPWSEGARRTGLVRDAMYLIRPDGHIALVSHRQDISVLIEYTRRHGLAFAAHDFAAGGTGPRL